MKKGILVILCMTMLLSPAYARKKSGSVNLASDVKAVQAAPVDNSGDENTKKKKSVKKAKKHKKAKKNST